MHRDRWHDNQIESTIRNPCAQSFFMKDSFEYFCAKFSNWTQYAGVFCFVLAVPSEKWIEVDTAHHRAHAMRLLDGLDVIGRERRLKVARAILYMAQGLA